MTDNKPLVSIITPCYNDSKYVNRYFESIMNQTYSNLEVIFVNDGSSDNTEQIALEFGEKLKEVGISFTYHYQENSGALTAVLWGIQNAKGKYITWPDVDDYMYADSISDRVEWLEKHTEVATLCTTLDVIDEMDGKLVGNLTFSQKAQKDPMAAMILMKDAYVSPIGYMTNREKLQKVLSETEVYRNKKCGQNWQLLLPLVYKYGIEFSQNKAGYYLVRQKSISHTKNYDAEKSRIIACEEVLVNTLKNIDNGELLYTYKKQIGRQYAILKLRIAAYYSQKADLKRFYSEMMNNHSFTWIGFIYYLAGRTNTYSLMRKIKTWFYK